MDLDEAKGNFFFFLYIMMTDSSLFNPIISQDFFYFIFKKRRILTKKKDRKRKCRTFQHRIRGMLDSHERKTHSYNCIHYYYI